MTDHNLIRDVGLAVLGAAAFALPAYLLRLPLLLAYLAAGVALGPHLGFSIIKSSESIQTLSEIGLILLMFILGLEIDIRKLMQAGKAVLVNGVTQFLGCALLAFALFGALGYKVGSGSYELVYLAVACSLSSTLVVVKILSDRMELDSLTSRITLGILVLQDIWAIAFLAVQPSLDALSPIVLGTSLGKVLILVAFAWAFARYALPWIFARVGKQPELMLITAMAWCFGVCGLASFLGLSKEMGALVAGVAVASFPYHADIAAKIASLRDFFITLFFVALGLQIQVPNSGTIGLAAVIVVFAVLSRVVTIFPVLYFLRYGNRASLVPALNLSQISEFSLVLAALGVSYNHLSNELFAGLVLALVATTLLSSLIIPNAHGLYRVLNRALEKVGFRDAILREDTTHTHDGEPHIVLLGFYREASSLLQELVRRHSHDALRQLLVVDYNPEAHQKLKELGVRAKYGDIGSSDVLRHLELEKAKILFCTIPDHLLKGTSNLKLLRVLKGIAPEARVVVTAETIASARAMYEAGADYVFVPRIVSAHFLADALERIQSGNAEVIRKGAIEFLSTWREVLP